MARPVTLFTGQWADLPFEEVCKKASKWGYDGLEIACWGDHMNVRKAARDKAYVEEKEADSQKAQALGCWALGAHLAGQCVGDNYDPRLNGFAPDRVKGKPQKLRQWAIEEMKITARAAKAMGCSGRQRLHGLAHLAGLVFLPADDRGDDRGRVHQDPQTLDPILDEFDHCGVKFALEVHPTEIAFDLYTADRLLTKFGRRPALGFNFDPSHLVWQGVEPHLFIREFADRIYHVHMKDAGVTLDGKAGILGSHPALRRPAARLEFPLPRSRRRPLRGDHPRAQQHRLHRAALRGMGGQRHGPGIRGQGSLRLRPLDQLRPIRDCLRQGLWEMNGAPSGKKVGNRESRAVPPRLHQVDDRCRPRRRHRRARPEPGADRRSNRPFPLRPRTACRLPSRMISASP